MDASYGSTITGRLTLDVDGVSYLLQPVEVLDENIRTCDPQHRDALLDARLDLYPAKENA